MHGDEVGANQSMSAIASVLEYERVPLTPFRKTQSDQRRRVHSGTAQRQLEFQPGKDIAQCHMILESGVH
jgi:hypothetical protein